ncbi:tagaturonate reductase [Bacteroides caecigallinarum]|uniref:tagaturonate reductase n=1 Tax=Bacteroides caecigallinarum TaxID=1411144 RepID=UPI001955F91E|nr:tagaturonate reductase [Bacteroides caecigallinarum]MBM6889065.1 tagaturonate reductase [Bacteroides caecigallinarum]
MKQLNINTAVKTKRPERIIQFGEGNFLRAFVDWIISNMNEKTDFNSSVVVVQPIEKGMIDALNSQDCLYHVNLQGLDNGKTVNSYRMIDVISRALNPYHDFKAFMSLAEQPEMRFVISNTTEAGIAFDSSCKLDDAPASSYPGKLTQLLYHRFKFFNGDPTKGLIIFPCELIFLNGHKLKDTIYQYIELWNLGNDFKEWFEKSCGVYATLVDRIVPGFPKKDIDKIKEELGYDDNMVVRGEAFHLWVIEAPQSVAEEFPADKAGLNVLFVPSEEPYHERKVTLLNGPHTVLSPVAYLSGVDIVRDACQHEVIGKYIHRVMFDELMETLNLPMDELKQFAENVLERFNNPFVDHQVTSIMLNSFPKYATRDLPGLKVYLQRKGCLPEGLVLGLAAIIVYYKGGKRQDGTDIIPNDAPEIMQLLTDLWSKGSVEELVKDVLGAVSIWNEDLNNIPGLHNRVVYYINNIMEHGMLETVKGLVAGN